MDSSFPVTSVTLIAKIQRLGPGQDSAEWVRFWNTYSLAIRHFAVLRGGAENADDIVMQVLAKLVDVLRSGKYTPEKGRFHSYLATMIANEVHMQHRKNVVRAEDRKVSLDTPISSSEGADVSTYGDQIPDPDAVSPEKIDEDWRKAVLKSAVEYVLTRTALSQRDREVYRAYAIEGQDIAKVAADFKISRNSVSQIKTRIDRRIVSVGQDMVKGEL